jgi:GNAT superfamily N-acetyltransferase
VLAVSSSNWSDFAALFGARGAPHYCWCSIYRFRDAHELSKPQKRRAMQRLVQGGTPIGVLAYDGDTPVGWCSVAPRESYVKLQRSRSMPRVSDEPTWTVLCFYVQRSHRGGGVAQALLAGAIDVARQQGARVIEGYPHDTAGISASHRGKSRLFRALGFQRQGTRWFCSLEPAKA